MAESSRRLDKCKIVYSIVAAVLFVVLFIVTFGDNLKKQEQTTVRIVMMGDSIVGECRDETSVPSLLSEMLGEPVFNGGLGGTTMGRVDPEMRLANTKECLSMQALSLSIVAEDYELLQTVNVREPATEYFDETINELAKIDFDSVDILFIGHGLNDYHVGTAIYNEENPDDTHTFAGAIRSTIEQLQKEYPDMRIILLTPTYSWYILNEEPEQTCENNDFGGGILEDYVNAEIQLAQSLGVEVIDLYHNFYPNEQWSDWEKYTIDGLHPNEAGRRMIAEAIYQHLEANEVRQ